MQISFMTISEQPVVAILAGGQSRRMGQDKALLQWDGEALLERAIRAGAAIAEAVAVVGREGAREGVIWLADDVAGLGPLGGLRTSLAHFGRPVALLGCDMPLVDAEALRWLFAQFSRSRAPHGFVTLCGAACQPLFAVYRPALLPQIDAQLATGRLAMRKLLESGGFDAREAPAQVCAKLVNINTPQDFSTLTGE